MCSRVVVFFCRHRGIYLGGGTRDTMPSPPILSANLEYCNLRAGELTHLVHGHISERQFARQKEVKYKDNILYLEIK